MTLYLCIASYLACAVLSYGVLCGRLWREIGRWDRRLTWLALYGAVFWPVCVPLDLLAFRGTIRPRWYFRSRKPAKVSARPKIGDLYRQKMEENDRMLKKQIREAYDRMTKLEAAGRERRRQQFRDTGPQEGTVAHKMRSLSEDAEKLRAEQEAVRVRRLKLDALSWAVDTISHKAKDGCHKMEIDADFRDWEDKSSGPSRFLSKMRPFPDTHEEVLTLMRKEVLPFLAKSLRNMGFRVEETIGIGELSGITHIRVEW